MAGSARQSCTDGPCLWRKKNRHRIDGKVQPASHDSIPTTIQHAHCRGTCSCVAVLLASMPSLAISPCLPSVAIPTGQRQQVQMPVRARRAASQRSALSGERLHDSKPRAITARPCQPPAQRRSRASTSVIRRRLWLNNRHRWTAVYTVGLAKYLLCTACFAC
jgi:hypothetical protein